LHRATYRVRGEIIDIFPAESDGEAVRVELFDDQIDSLAWFDPLTGEVLRRVPRITIYPKTHYATPRAVILGARDEIREDLKERLKELNDNNKLVEAQQGNNLKTATVGLYPTRRTSLHATFRDREVGLNPGEVWSGSFDHHTRRTTWNARYEERTTTQQQQVLEDGGFVIRGFDPDTGLFNDPPQPGDLLFREPVGPVLSITDEVFERKRASGTFGMKTGKTGLRLTVFDERRRFLTSLTEEETKGLSGSLNRRLAPQTNGILSGSYRRITGNAIGSDTEFMYVQVEVTRQMSRKINGSASYRFTIQDSEDDDRNYNENRIVVRLIAVF
jgi:uncharacterized protein (PEP-CTERM system associated)